MRWDAQAIHAYVQWPAVLAHLGIDERFLRNKPGPCPACGGKDRYRFDDWKGRGDFYCNGCGAGDGFALLMRVHGWTFAEARRAVIEAGDLNTGRPRPELARRQVPVVLPDEPARPTARVNDLLRTSTTPDAVPDVIEYLRSRGLRPLPPGCTLRAHAHAEYWHRDDNSRSVCIGRFPALVAEVRDINGERVTAHITYLQDGRKLSPQVPRKLLGKLTGRRGCAIRLMPVEGNELGIAEGIESALAASVLHGLPVWSALDAGLLAKFEPPPGVHRLIIYADRDVAGLKAAIDLNAALEGRVDVVIETPSWPWNDFADVLEARASQ